MKNILVCIKQVPDTTEIRIDPVKKTLIREGVPSIVNPFDAYALELAARIKDSYILSCAIKKLEELEGKFDIIFCGKQAIDGDTAQVGPEIAEHIGLPQVTYAIEAEAEEDRLVIKKEVEAGFEKVAVSYPCLITVTKPSFDPRFPTISRDQCSRLCRLRSWYG